MGPRDSLPGHLSVSPRGGFFLLRPVLSGTGSLTRSAPGRYRGLGLPAIHRESGRVCCSRALIHHSISCPQHLDELPPPEVGGKPRSFASLAHPIRWLTSDAHQLSPAEAGAIGWGF